MKKALYLSLPLFVSASLFAEDAAPAARQQSMWQTLMMIGIALLFFYLILWRPEQKRRKKMEKQRSGMSKGDRVTAMGIIGTVVRVEESTVILKMVDGAKIEVLKSAISDVQPASEQQTVDVSKPQTNGTE
jgi:preprotein translocase subunit YajC